MWWIEGARKNRVRGRRGVTLLELLITLVLISVLVSAAMPLSRLNTKREKEIELRAALREMRDAIDRFEFDWRSQRISRVNADSDVVNIDTGYPATLQSLVNGAPVAHRPDDKKIRYLRQIPVDPFTGSTDWKIRCYKDDPDSFISCGHDVYDVASQSDQTGLIGIPYTEW
jgi:general secretion pathway protein G